MRFHVGDQVRLKSGGPTLTVAKITGDEVLCFWFESSECLHQQVFPAATLGPSIGDFDLPLDEPLPGPDAMVDPERREPLSLSPLKFSPTQT
jgi:uncharacterized protein YodC (DUF2158 family)